MELPPPSSTHVHSVHKYASEQRSLWLNLQERFDWRKHGDKPACQSTCHFLAAKGKATLSLAADVRRVA